jgi:hypothetical protein
LSQVSRDQIGTLDALADLLVELARQFVVALIAIESLRRASGGPLQQEIAQWFARAQRETALG